MCARIFTELLFNAEPTIHSLVRRREEGLIPFLERFALNPLKVMLALCGIRKLKMRLLFLLFHHILLLSPFPPQRFSYRAILNIPQKTNGFLVTPLFNEIPYANGHRTWIILQFCCDHQVHSHPEHCPFPDTCHSELPAGAASGGSGGLLGNFEK